MSKIEAIDFEKLKQQETAKASKVFTFKQATREDLYNVLQDLRHIVMFDLRSKGEFYPFNIRDSFCVEDAQYDERIIENFFEEAEKKYSAEEAKYKTKPIRRVFLVDSNQRSYDENNKNIKFIMDCVRKFGGFDRVFYLKQGIEHFAEKYGFLCINYFERDKEKATQATEQDKSKEQPILSPFQKKYYYAFSRFPTEFLDGKIFLGSVHNANNQPQMQDLGIKSIVELISYKDQKIPDHKIAKYTYKNIPIDDETAFFIDLDDICKYIDELLANNSTYPVLINCKDGDTISPCIIIAYMMWHKKMTLTMASILVYQKRGSAEANKNLYTVLSTWAPKGANKGNQSSFLLK